MLLAAAPSLPAFSPKLPLAECPSNTSAYDASFAAASTNAYAATGSAPPVPSRYGLSGVQARKARGCCQG